MPHFLQNWNWTDLLYGLIPLLYILSQFLGSKEEKKEDSDSPETQQRKREEEAALAERRRRIQEEIRRRIAGEDAVSEPAKQPQAAPRKTAPARSLHDQRQPDPAARRTSPQANPSRSMPASDVSRTSDGGYGNDIEARLARQKEALRRSQREHEAARKRAAEIGSEIGSIAQAGQAPSNVGASAVRKEVLAAIRSGQNLRSAIVLAEILGPPVSQRREIGERLF